MPARARAMILKWDCTSEYQGDFEQNTDLQASLDSPIKKEGLGISILKAFSSPSFFLMIHHMYIS